jgi:nucleotide-binding universal stress UspA family protein
MTQTQQPPSNSPRLIVGFDFSEPSTRALDQAVRFSASWPGTETIVVHATNGPVSRLPDEDDATAEARVLRELVATIEAHFKQLDEEGAPVRTTQTTAHLSLDPPVKAITGLAYMEGADLILVGGSDKGSLERLVLGSVAEGILKAAPCSVLVCRERMDRKDPQIEAPHPPEYHSTLGRRHTYHHKSRNAESREGMPLVFRTY